MEDAIGDVSTFSKNRERFLEGEIIDEFFQAIVTKAREAGLAATSISPLMEP